MRSGKPLKNQPTDLSLGRVISLDAARKERQRRRVQDDEDRAADLLAAVRVGRAPFSFLITALVQPFNREDASGLA